MPLIRPGTEIDQLTAFGAKWPEFVSLGPLNTVPAGRAVDDSRGGVCHVAISPSGLKNAVLAFLFHGFLRKPHIFLRKRSRTQCAFLRSLEAVSFFETASR